MNRTAKAARTANVRPRNETSDNSVMAAFRPLARLLAPLIQEEMSGNTGEDWLDQSRSPLGARRHCELARSGTFPGARKVGRKWLVPCAALDAYIRRTGLVPSVCEDVSEQGRHDQDRAVLAVLAEVGCELAPSVDGRPTGARG